MEYINESLQTYFSSRAPLQGASPEGVLSYLTKTFSGLLDLHNFNVMAKADHWDQQFVSHVKSCLFSEEIGDQRLKLELLCFRGKVPTPLHNHPEFLIERVLEGTLLEQQFSISDRAAKICCEEIRPQGHQRSIYDPQGHPHVVRSMTKTCLTLCLSYGRPVADLPIKE